MTYLRWPGLWWTGVVEWWILVFAGRIAKVPYSIDGLPSIAMVGRPWWARYSSSLAEVSIRLRMLSLQSLSLKPHFCSFYIQRSDWVGRPHLSVPQR